jgi:hypothetical protein
MEPAGSTRQPVARTPALHLATWVEQRLECFDTLDVDADSQGETAFAALPHGVGHPHREHVRRSDVLVRAEPVKGLDGGGARVGAGSALGAPGWSGRGGPCPRATAKNCKRMDDPPAGR